MANIQKRGELQWRALVRKTGFQAFSRTFERKADAEGWATDVEAAIGRRDMVELRRLTDHGLEELRTVGDLVTKFLVDVVEQPGRSKKRAGNERPRLARIRAEFGRIPLEMLSPVDVTRWRDRRTFGGEGAQKVTHDMNQLSVLLNTAITEWGVTSARNVVAGVKRPCLPSGRARRLGPSEAEYLFRTLDIAQKRCGRRPNRGMRPIIVLGIETSMREGELVGLEWKRIDLEMRFVHLPTTKNGEARSVALSSRAVEALKQMRVQLRKDGKVFDWANSSSFGRQFAKLVKSARKLYLSDCAATGVQAKPDFLTNLKFHDLRHEAASRLFEAGLNVMEVASMTGHKTLQMLKRYTHVDASKLAAKLG